MPDPDLDDWVWAAACRKGDWERASGSTAERQRPSHRPDRSSREGPTGPEAH